MDEVLCAITGLEELPATVTQLTDLVDLSLAGNKLTSLPASIGKLTKVRFIMLQDIVPVIT